MQSLYNTPSYNMDLDIYNTVIFLLSSFLHFYKGILGNDSEIAS